MLDYSKSQIQDILTYDKNFGSTNNQTYFKLLPRVFISLPTYLDVEF